LFSGIKNLLDKKVNNHIMQKQKVYQQNYDKDWNNKDNEEIFFIHEVQNGKVYRNY
jgi:hypothetical protein